MALEGSFRLLNEDGAATTLRPARVPPCGQRSPRSALTLLPAPDGPGAHARSRLHARRSTPSLLVGRYRGRAQPSGPAARLRRTSSCAGRGRVAGGPAAARSSAPIGGESRLGTSRASRGRLRTRGSSASSIVSEPEAPHPAAGLHEKTGRSDPRLDRARGIDGREHRRRDHRRRWRWGLNRRRRHRPSGSRPAWARASRGGDGNAAGQGELTGEG